VAEDLPDRQLDAHALAAAGARQRIDLVDLGDQAPPTRAAALARLVLLPGLILGLVGLAGRPPRARGSRGSYQEARSAAWADRWKRWG
jgi:hypothetical protein